MKKALKVHSILAVAIMLSACTSAAPHAERWRVRVVGTDGRFVGGLILELTSEPSSKSCVSIPDTVVARIVERQGFADDHVRDEAAVHLKDGELYADLSVGMCDHTLTIGGIVHGRRAVGEVRRSTLIGAIKVGTFIAEKQ